MLTILIHKVMSEPFTQSQSRVVRNIGNKAIGV